MNRPRRILLCSATALEPGGSIVSVGDEAVADALADALRARFDGVEVWRTLNTTRAPAARVAPDRVRVRPVRGLVEAIRDADLVIAGGGTMFQEDVVPRRYEPVAGLLRFLATVAVVARAHRRPLAVVGVGAEGLHHRRSRAAARFVLRGAATVSARDAASADLLRRISGRPVAVGADTMFLPGVRTPSAPGQGPARPVCVSLRRDAPAALIRGLAAWLEREDNRERSVTLVPMDRRADSDGAALGELARRLGRPGRCRIVGAGATWREVFQEVAAADLCVGMRLHFAIFAALAGRPTVVLDSLPKTHSFARDVGLTIAPLEAPAQPLAVAMDRAAPPDAARLGALRARGDVALGAIEAAVGGA